MPTARGRRKKAQPTLAVVDEDVTLNEDRINAVEQPVRKETPLQHFQDKICEVDVQVERAAEVMWEEALADVDRIRQEFKALFMKIPKKVRETSVAQFLNLTEEEAQQPFVSNFRARLEVMAHPAPDTALPAPATVPITQTAGLPQADNVPLHVSELVAAHQAEVVPAPDVGQPDNLPPPSAAPATRMTRRTAARTGLPPDPLPPPATTTKRRTRATVQRVEERQPQEQPPPELPGQDQSTVSVGVMPVQVASSSQAATALTAGPRRVTRQALKAMDSNTNAVPRQALATPSMKRAMGSRHTCIEATPAVTAKAGRVLASFTLVRKQPPAMQTPGGVLRSGAEQPSHTANALLFTTAGGEQFELDAEKGLEDVPAEHLADIHQHMELMQRMAAAALAKRV